MRKRSLAIPGILLVVAGALGFPATAHASGWACSATATNSNRDAGCPVSGLKAASSQSADVTNNAWNWGPKIKSQSVRANAAGNWQSITNDALGNTAVLQYPSLQDTVTTGQDKPVPFASYYSLRSSYRVVPPAGAARTDDWEYDYDFWLGSSSANYAQEIMVWTDNHGQRPAGNDTHKTWTDPYSHATYEIWVTPRANPTVTFAAKANATTGKVGIKNVYNELRALHLTTMTGVNQISYGIEICSTSGRPETFAVTAYSVDGVTG